MSTHRADDRRPDQPTDTTQQTGMTQPAGAPSVAARARSRRDVLSVAGLGVLGGGVLAACGTGSPDAASAPTAAATVPTTAAPPSTTAAATSAAPTADAATSAPAATAASSAATPSSTGLLSVPTSDVPVGGGTIYKQQKIVVTQPSAGQFKAFSAVCPHQGCTVAEVVDKEIQCPCHASAFDYATGAVLGGPAPTGLTVETATVRGSDVVVT